MYHYTFDLFICFRLVTLQRHEPDEVKITMVWGKAPYCSHYMGTKRTYH